MSPEIVWCSCALTRNQGVILCLVKKKKEVWFGINVFSFDIFTTILAGLPLLSENLKKKSFFFRCFRKIIALCSLTGKLLILVFVWLRYQKSYTGYFVLRYCVSIQKAWLFLLILVYLQYVITKLMYIIAKTNTCSHLVANEHFPITLFIYLVQFALEYRIMDSVNTYIRSQLSK